jgi:protein SCO1/2
MPSSVFRLLSGAAALLAALLVVGCQDDDVKPAGAPKDLVDVSDASFELVNQDSAAVRFPADFLGRGDVLVVNYVYTHCPDICGMATANLKQVRDTLGSTEDVQFITISFDPWRDTPAKLASYRSSYRLPSSWQFLTGSPDTIDRVMEKMGIRRQITTRSGAPAAPDTTDSYLINHTDQVSLINAEGMVRYEHSASRTPPEMLVEDINRLREAG